MSATTINPSKIEKTPDAVVASRAEAISQMVGSALHVGSKSAHRRVVTDQEIEIFQLQDIIEDDE